MYENAFKISVVKAPFPPFENLKKYFSLVAEAGFYRFWTSDVESGFDPFLFLFSLNQIQSSFPLGISVVNTSLYHPFSVARKIITISSLMKNPVVIGLGAGDKYLAKTLKIPWGIDVFLEKMRFIQDYFDSIGFTEIMSQRAQPLILTVGTQNHKIIKSLPSIIQGIIFNSASISEINLILNIRNFDNKYVFTPILIDSNSEINNKFKKLITLSARSLPYEYLSALKDKKIKNLLLSVKNNSNPLIRSEDWVLLGKELGLVLNDESHLNEKLGYFKDVGITEVLIVGVSPNDFAKVISILNHIKKKV